MTNLQKGAPVLSAKSLRRLWFGAPAAALGLASMALGAAVLLPMWQALQRDNTRLRELESIKVQMSLMRQQLRAQDIQEEKSLEQRQKLFRMIAGSGDVSTLLAVLDREAKASGVRLDLYEPQAGAAQPAVQATQPAAANQAKPPPANPLEAAGLQAQSMLISVHGPYPNLLAFLRRLESLNLLVIQSDLRLEAPAPGAGPSKTTSRDVTMKLSLRVYSKPGGDEDQTTAPSTTPPAATPVAPGAPPAPTGSTPAAPAPSGAPAPAPPAQPASPPATAPGSAPGATPAPPAQRAAPPAGR